MSIKNTFDLIKTIIDGVSLLKDSKVIFTIIGTISAFVFKYSWIVYIVLVFLIFCIIWIKVRKYQKDAGIRENRCEIVPYYRFKVHNKSGQLACSIHKQLYHNLYSVKDSLIQSIIDNPKIEIEKCKDIVEKALVSFHAFFYKVFYLDLNISIFMLYRENGNIVLRRVFSCESFSENEKTGRRKHCNDVPYFVDRVKKGKEPDSDNDNDYQSITIEDVVLRAKEYDKKNGNNIYKKNSAFDFVLSSTERFWMSNNLENDKFYSSSDNFKKFYNSLAAFAITRPGVDYFKQKNIKGILSFDSMKTNIFSEKECLHIMALMAHFLYDIFEEFNLKKTIEYEKIKTQAE